MKCNLVLFLSYLLYMFGSEIMVQEHLIYENFLSESLVKLVALWDVSAIRVYLKQYTQRSETG